MGFLDQPLTDLNKSELIRIIQQEIARHTQPIPAGLRDLADNQVPVIAPSDVVDSQTLIYDPTLGAFDNQYVSSASIVANTISSTEIVDQLQITGKFTTSPTQAGQRVDIDSTGLTVYDSNGNPVIVLPADSTRQLLISGSISASSVMAAAFGLQIGGNSDFLTSSVTTLDAGIIPPNLPNVQKTWPNQAFTDLHTNVFSRRGGYYDSSGTGAVPTFWTCVALDSGQQRHRYVTEYRMSDMVGLREIDLGPSREAYGVARIGTRVFVLYQDVSTNIWWFTSYDWTTLSRILDTQLSGTEFIGTQQINIPNPIHNERPGMLVDGTTFYIITTNASGNSRLKLVPFTDSGVGDAVQGADVLLDSGFLAKSDETNTYGGCKIGSQWYVSAYEDNTHPHNLDGIYAFDTATGNRHSSLDFGTSVFSGKYYPNSIDNGYAKILFYDGTQPWSTRAGANLGKHSNEYWATDSASHFQITWYDGSHETMASADYFSTIPNRASALIAFQALPPTVTQARVYIGTSSARANQHLQTSSATSPITQASYSGAGANPPAASSFPTGDSTLQSSTLGTAPAMLTGQGQVILPRFTVAQRISSPTKAAIEFNEDTTAPEYYDGSKWQPLGNASGVIARGFDYTQDFLAGVIPDELVTSVAGGGTLLGTNPGTARNPGQAQMDTGATSNSTGASVFRLGTSGTAAGPIIIGNGVVRVGCVIKMPSTLTLAQIRVGLVDTSMIAGDPTSGFFFRFDSTLNSGKWEWGVVGGLGDSLITVVAGNWYQLEIIVAANGLSADFYINGSKLGTISGFTITNTLHFEAACVKNQVTTTARAFTFDAFWVSGDLNANRWT